jgi:hypothetical protein
MTTLSDIFSEIQESKQNAIQHYNHPRRVLAVWGGCIMIY